MYIAGAADWGIYQKPGEFERMQPRPCAPTFVAHTSSKAPATGFSRKKPEQVTELLLDKVSGPFF